MYGEAEGSGHIEQRVKDRRSINLSFSNDLREDTTVKQELNKLGGRAVKCVLFDQGECR